jgi:hypothetical protein
MRSDKRYNLRKSGVGGNNLRCSRIDCSLYSYVNLPGVFQFDWNSRICKSYIKMNLYKSYIFGHHHSWVE